MAKSFIVIAIVIVIVLVGLIIFIISPGEESSLVEKTEDPSPASPAEEPLPISQDKKFSPISRGQKSLPPRPVTVPVTTVPVSINAVPWAKVFIKLPQGNAFIKPRSQDFTIPPDPNEKKSNVTPIRGSLKVPIGTTIKLVYQEKEKVFSYEAWKSGKSISHDFLNQ